MVLDKIRTDGLAATLEAVENKLDQPLTLGYCNVGVVAGLGAERKASAQCEVRGARCLVPKKCAQYPVPRKNSKADCVA